MKNSIDTIGNRAPDLPACSAVPQPTAPPRAPVTGDYFLDYSSHHTDLTQRCTVSSISNCRRSSVSYVNLELGSSVFACARREGLVILSCRLKIVGIVRRALHIITPFQDVKTHLIPAIKNLEKSKVKTKKKYLKGGGGMR